MKINQINIWISRIILLAFVLTSLAIAPAVSFDPFNPPKLLVLATFSGAILGLIVLLLNKEFLNKYLGPIIFSLLLIFSIGISTLLSNQDFTTTFYGVGGRNTGVLAYCSLIILFLASVITSSEDFTLKLAKCVGFVGILTILYSWLQILNVDPSPWKEESWIMSFFANPNFVSSFLGMSTAPAFATIFESTKFNLKKYLYIIYIFVCILTIKETYSLQGFIVTGIVIASVIYFKLNSVEKFLKLRKLYMFLVFLIFFWLVLDILQKTPGESILYKASVSSRGDFWRAAWQMGLDKPYFGWGLDSFRDRFTLYRDYDQAVGGEGHQLGEIAHNVFLDLFVGGGFILLIVYILLLLYTFYKVKSYILQPSQYKIGFVTVFSIFVSYIAQSVISANHLGLAVLGWICLGALVGYKKSDLETSGLSSTLIKSTNTKSLGKSSRSRRVVSLSLTFGIITGFLFAFPLYNTNVKQQTAANNKNADQYLAAALTWPRDSVRMSLLAERLISGGYYSHASTILNEALKVTPYSAIPLKVMRAFPNLDQNSKDELLRKIKLLDPYFEDSVAVANKS
jgi:O-antigen ligase